MNANSQTTSPDTEDYDVYNVSFDAEVLPYIADLPPSQESQEILPQEDEELIPDVPASPKSAHSDEFSKYDFSEFTMEELAAFDDRLSTPKHEDEHEDAHEQPQAKHEAFGNMSSGPAIQIEVENSADIPMGRQTCVKAANDAPRPRHEKPYTKESNYNRFKRRVGTLSVTDLTGPAWCEYQWDYGLLQKRNKPLKDRPAAFATGSGKIIQVDKQVAATINNISKRGSIVHKALEREIHPEKVPVKVTTTEEKWALRILQMIECMQLLATSGQCREMPVFGILDGQLITGCIDEIRRILVLSPMPTPSVSPAIDRKHEREAASIPVTPSKPKIKKSRRSPSPSQPEITNFFSPSRHGGLHVDTITNATTDMPTSTDGVRTPTSAHADLSPMPAPLLHFRLHVSDTKSRNMPTLPADADIEPAKLQLMFYHRLLSNLLANPSTSAQGFAFEAFWSHLNVSSSRQFSKAFQAEALLDDDVTCLLDLERMWRNAVEMACVDCVDDTLEIVYRTQVKRIKKTKFKGHDPWKAKANAAVQKRVAGFGNLSKGERKAILRAFMTSLKEQDEQAPADTDIGIKENVEEPDTIVDPTVLKSPESESPASHADTLEPPVNAAAQEGGSSAQPAVQKPDLNGKQPAVSEATPERDVGVAVDTASSSSSNSDSDSDSDSAHAKVRAQSMIIGTKVFEFDSKALDAYLSSILGLWYGKRVPKGVDVELTRRCTSCEYQNGCEWREMKAAEASTKVRRQPSGATTSS